MLLEERRLHSWKLPIVAAGEDVADAPPPSRLVMDYDAVGAGVSTCSHARQGRPHHALFYLKRTIPLLLLLIWGHDERPMGHCSTILVPCVAEIMPQTSTLGAVRSTASDLDLR